jgi:hypothetical protein
MRMNRWVCLSALIMILILLLACAISFNGGESTDDVKDAIQQTLQAMQTQTAAAAAQVQPPIETQSGTAPEEESEPEPTLTVNPTPCNASRMTDETIPDGTRFDPDEAFTKTWTLRNNGSCEWNTDYRFVFEDGDRMGGEISQNLDSVVKPGKEITLSVDLEAPSDDGDYTGVWRLMSGDGEKLGKYWVNIVVGIPSGPFAVTSVSFYMPHTTIDTSCPHNVTVKAEITSNAAGKVVYYWLDSTGETSTYESHTFDEAGKKIVEYKVKATSSDDYWAKLYIDNPNHQWFGPINFHVNCTP